VKHEAAIRAGHDAQRPARTAPSRRGGGREGGLKRLLLLRRQIRAVDLTKLGHAALAGAGQCHDPLHQ
jgi:hypothetical protein